MMSKFYQHYKLGFLKVSYFIGDSVCAVFYVIYIIILHALFLRQGEYIDCLPDWTAIYRAKIQ